MSQTRLPDYLVPADDAGPAAWTLSAAAMNDLRMSLRVASFVREYARAAGRLREGVTDSDVRDKIVESIADIDVSPGGAPNSFSPAVRAEVREKRAEALRFVEALMGTG